MADSEKTPDHNGNAASDNLAESGSISLASTYGINESKLLAKIDLRLLPAVSILYLLSFLDRSNGTLLGD